ncbi:hypothetical protein BBO_04611 [Beauveria brongniartii RCEF 3172]|uniref:Uncharacterized protein n=1 Tax=Beauveria brongniartii RCEF 3172 TaxID=1081107 RepID=A0A162JF95_9HYPO|nr:hypothetical protein BBO_04611 [Beauveria brongniartii RCEF 3172]
MPRKRAAPSDSGTSQAKKTKTTKAAASTVAAPIQEVSPSDSGSSRAKKTKTTKAAPKTPLAPLLRVPERWSAVSVSANVARGHEEWLAKPDEAWVWECSCPPRFERPISSFWDDEEDEEDEEDSEDKAAKQPECGGETCMCNKKAVDHPDYPWVLTMVGKQLYLSQYVLATMRDPDNFQMYTYNDHYGYGLIEMLQNLILDYPVSCGWKESWCVLEAAVMWLLDPEADAIIHLIGRMFLHMLATLELDGRGVRDAVLNLGTIMALYIKLAQDSRQNNLLCEDEEDEELTGGVIYSPPRFDDYVLAYAKKFDVTLCGPKELDKLIDECRRVGLPEVTLENDDPWNFFETLQGYEGANYRAPPRGSIWYDDKEYRGIGGDHYDISSWRPVERRKASFDKKDPFTRSMINAVKQGLVMHRG